jgi:hypothetical protein
MFHRLGCSLSVTRKGLFGAFVFAALAFAESAAADESITCASDHGSRRVCPVDNVMQRKVTLARDLSNGTCAFGKNWGTYAPGIWVDAGCKATFTVSGSGGSTSDAHGNNAAAAAVGIAALAAIALAVSKSNDKDGHGHNDRNDYGDHNDYGDDDYDTPGFVLHSCGRKADDWVRDRDGRSASLDRVTKAKKKHGDWELKAYYRFRYKHDSNTRFVHCVVDDDGRVRTFEVD